MVRIVKNVILTSLCAFLAAGCINTKSRPTDAVEVVSQAQATRQVYIASVSQSSLDGFKLTRAQLIGLINYRYLTPDRTDITTIDALLENRTGIESVEYDAESLGLKWAVMNDSIVSLEYYGEPVRALIYIYNDTITKNRYIFHPDELIWVSDHFVYRDSVRYSITPQLSLLIDSLAVDVKLPNIFTDTNVLLPIDIAHNN